MKYKAIILTLGILFYAFITYSQQYQEMSIKEIRQVIQIAIDFPELQQYYHFHKDSTRIPLVIKEFGLINSENLKGIEKFGIPIKVLTEEEIKAQKIQSYLNIGDWTCVNNQFRLQIEYSIEGLLINYMFKKEKDNWVLINSKIIEE